MRVLYDGLDPDLQRVTIAADELRRAWGVGQTQPVIGIVGNVREWKGQETVVRALGEVVQRFPDVVCFFVGAATPADEPYVRRLHALAASLGVSGHVRFTGYQREIPSFINVMDVLIHASIAAEPFGMVVLEGMAQRKPVVGSRAGGVVEMVVDGETGYTFPPGDASALAQRVCELLADPARASRMGEKGYARLVSSFTLAKYMREIHAVYAAVLEHRAVPAGIGLPTSAPAMAPGGSADAVRDVRPS
jgi:glycosyltransferase involved in cell wall biosynthesis